MAIHQTLDSNDVQERKFKIVIVGNVELDYLAKVVIFYTNFHCANTIKLKLSFCKT